MDAAAVKFADDFGADVDMDDADDLELGEEQAGAPALPITVHYNIASILLRCSCSCCNRQPHSASWPWDTSSSSSAVAGFCCVMMPTHSMYTLCAADWKGHSLRKRGSAPKQVPRGPVHFAARVKSKQPPLLECRQFSRH